MACSPSGAYADAYGYGHASAYAQGELNEDDSDGTTLAFEHDVSASNNPNNSTPPDSLAIARSYGHAFGPSGVYVSVGGHTDNAPSEYETDISSEASAASFSEYRIESSSLADGQAVTVNLSLYFDGSLSLKQDEARQLSGYDLYCFVYTDMQLGQNGGGMDIIYEGGADLFAGEQFDYSDWEGRGVFSSDGAGLWTGTFDIADVVTIDTTVGSTLQFSPNLWAEAYLAQPNGAEAVVDFYDTSRFSFAPAEGEDFAIVPIDPVPEPSAFAIVAGCAALLMGRRRGA